MAAFDRLSDSAFPLRKSLHLPVRFWYSSKSHFVSIVSSNQDEEISLTRFASVVTAHTHALCGSKAIVIFTAGVGVTSLSNFQNSQWSDVRLSRRSRFEAMAPTIKIRMRRDRRPKTKQGRDVRKDGQAEVFWSLTCQGVLFSFWKEPRYRLHQVKRRLNGGTVKQASRRRLFSIRLRSLARMCLLAARGVGFLP